MPYNEQIDARLRNVLADWENTEVKKMFGGTCHLLNGNMVCGVYKEYLIVRLDPGEAIKALEKAHTRPFDITGRPMRGWVMVEKAGFESEVELRDWLDRARRFVETLPPKKTHLLKKKLRGI